ncbi:hypothetical protein LLG46_14015 [bacterium]|nr:hypothetical protein [bacterium]
MSESLESDLTITSNKKPISRNWMLFVVLAGVAFPAFVFCFELATRLCSSIFFDPIPTAWHAVFLALVPITNIAVLILYSKRSDRYVTLLTFMAGASIGIEFCYSIVFVPLAPISIIGTMAYGIGLCGLSPFLAFAASIVSGNRLKELYPQPSRKRAWALWSGIIAASLILIVYAVSNYVTYSGLDIASSANEKKSLRGIRMIRTFGNKNALLRACYGLRAGPDDGLFSNTTPADRNKAREVYYRVTGESFNSVPPPKMFGSRARLVEDSEWDSDVGGTAVNGIVKNLSLASSRMDASIQPDSLTGYTEWTMTFSNSSFTEREARAEIALPPGGVVSRLTLWVAGEEREAAFSSRGKVRQAYQQVAVVQQRDPVLVTTCGPDRVLMQCFPVPANGTMKVRIGITSPLVPQGYSKGLFVLPHFIERNFKIDESIEHSLVASSPKEMRFANGNGLVQNCLRATIDDSALGSSKRVIVCSRNADVRSLCTDDIVQPSVCHIVEKLVEYTQPAPSKVVVVIDGSRKVGEYKNEIAQALRGLPHACKFSVIQAGEKVETLSDSSDSVDKASDMVSDMRFVGGIDNRPALIKAYDATKDSGSVIVWIHGPQPLSSGQNADKLMQLWERTYAPQIISVEAVAGRNSILADMEKTGAVTVHPRMASLRQDLEALFGQWKGHKQLRVVRTKEPCPKQTREGSLDIARLWAAEEVARVCRSRNETQLINISRLAALYRIVTPISGAVVLETDEQYRQNGLNPVDPTSVPSAVPEPATCIGLAVGIAALIGKQHIRLKRRSKQ